MKILIVEDDAALAQSLHYHLRQAGYEADICDDGEEALLYMRQSAHDLVLLDRMLPGMDGLSVLRALRGEGYTTPVLMITALDGIGERVSGLDAGADDYLVKPFAVEEMLARVRALSRRPTQWDESGLLRAVDITLDETRCFLSTEASSCALSKRETDLLAVLIKASPNAVTREVLLSRVWGFENPVEDGNLDNYVYFLRKRLKNIDSHARISTVRAVGYKLEAT